MGFRPGALAAQTTQGQPHGRDLEETLEYVSPLPAEALRQRLDGDRITQVQLGDLEVPLKESVALCEAAQSRDGRLAVLLAGGVRTSLDVYLIDRENGTFHVFHTCGGRRLPATFDDGHGSWPMLEGKALVLLAYEKHGRIQFRALDFEGCIHASRELPLSTTGFEGDTDSHFVRVTFQHEDRDGDGGREAPLVFPHPLAPRLELQSGLLAFGTVPVGGKAERRLVLSNTGRRPLELWLEPTGGPFRLPAGALWSVPAGGRVEVPVEFRPNDPGDHHVRLLLHARTRSPVRGGAVEPQGAVLLSGSCVDPAAALAEARATGGGAAQAATQASPLPATGSTSEERPQSPLAPVTAAARPPAATGQLPAPDPHHVWTQRLRGARVAVRGRVDEDELRRNAGLPLAIEVTAGEGPAVLVPIDADGKFVGELAAYPGERLRVTLVSGERRSESAVLGPVLPYLEHDGNDLVVRAKPEQTFLLLAVAVADEPLGPDGTRGEPRIVRTLRAWRGRAAGARGEARVPLTFLGAGSEPVHLVVIVESDGEVRRSNVLGVKPLASN